MPTYRVIRKSDGEEILRYCAVDVNENVNGMTYSFDEFEHVEYVEDMPVPVSKPEDWYITVGSFFDRFGVWKLPILASQDPIVQALIKDATVRKYIDLKGRRAELEQLIGLLQSKGFDIDPVAILDVQPSAMEVYRGD